MRELSSADAILHLAEMIAIVATVDWLESSHNQRLHLIGIHCAQSDLELLNIQAPFGYPQCL